MIRLILTAFLLSALANSALATYQTAYEIGPGDYTVNRAEGVVIPFPALDKDLQLRVFYPDKADPSAVIVFSHGGGCAAGRYDRLAKHWASHGYIVIQPTHSDSRSLGFSFEGMDPKKMLEVVFARRKDMRHILDSLNQVETQVPELGGQLDRERLIAAGHSMGGATVMAVTGLALENKRVGIVDRFEEDRFDALLLLGDPGNRSFMPEDPWRAIAVPTLIITGTNDHGQEISSGPMKFAFAEGTVLSDTANHYLFIDDMDHYLGGLVCRTDVIDEPDYVAMSIAKGVSIAFLNAYFADDAKAAGFIGSNEIETLTAGRARLEQR